jgi:hypothetical protein
MNLFTTPCLVMDSSPCIIIRVFSHHSKTTKQFWRLFVGVHALTLTTDAVHSTEPHIALVLLYDVRFRKHYAHHRGICVHNATRFLVVSGKKCYSR